MKLWTKLVIALVVLVIAFTAASGYAFTYATGIQDQVEAPYLQWWIWWWNWSDEPLVRWWLWVTGGPMFFLSAALVAAPLLYRPYGLVPAALPAYGLLHPPKPRSAFSRFFRPAASTVPVRSGTANYGTARLMTPQERSRLWRGGHPVHGGIAVAEDHDPREDGDYFEARDTKTWGRGGSTKLLVASGVEGSPHSLVVAGMGAGKTMALITTLAATWRSSAVILDPALEIAPMVIEARRRMGHRIFVLSLDTAEACGLNTLAGIDITSPAAETDVRQVVEWVTGYTPKQDQTHAFFKESGKALVTCFVTHIVWHPTAEPAVRTLRSLRKMIAAPQHRVIHRLEKIAETSESHLARDLAKEHLGAPSDTFGSMLLNAARDTDWLSTQAYADLVSGTAITPDQILDGKTDIFMCLPSKILDSAEAVARCLLGPLLRTCYDSSGAKHPMILFAIDEMYKIGRMAIIEQARDDSRKFGAAIHGLYQSEGQIEHQWGGHPGFRSWINACGWIAYSAVADEDTAKGISNRLGSYGMLVRGDSTNRGRPGGIGFRWLSRGHGITVNEAPHPVMSPSEILQLRPDARIVLPRSSKGAVLSSPLYYRRQEPVFRNLKPSPFYTPAKETTHGRA